MQKFGRQSFLMGALVLSAATMVVKVMGALFKIPLTNLLGGEGYGYFTAAYSLFGPIYALAVAGLPVAVSRMVAECAAQGRWRDCRRIRRLSGTVFFVAGLIGMLVMIFGAGTFVGYMGIPAALYPVMAMSPAVLFGCMTASHRGYYQGLGNMTPTAVSQIVEAVVKLFAGYLFAALLLRHLREGYRATGYVLRLLPENVASANRLILALSAAGAVLGIALSTLAGMLYLVIRGALRGDGIDRAMLARSPAPRPGGVLLASLLRIALPVCIAAVVTNLTSVIDMTTMLTRLGDAIARSPELFRARYADVFASGVAAGELPNFLHGCYQGLVVVFFNIIPSLTATFGTSALPAVAAAWSVGNRAGLSRNIGAILRITCLFAIPAGLGLATLSGPILRMLYGPLEAAVAAPLLRLAAVAAIFAALISPLYACFQAIGRQDLPVKFVLSGAAIKTAANYILIGIPEIGMKGAPIGSILSFAVIVVLALSKLYAITGVFPDLVGAFVKPGFAGALCAAAAFTAHGFLARTLPGWVAVAGAVGIAVVVYLVALLCVRGIDKQDVRMLPKGEKIAWLLEKKRLIR